MTLNDFIIKYLGKKIDWDGYYGGQCVDLYRQYVDEVLEFPQPKGVAGAKDFWTNFETDPSLFNYYKKIPNTPTGIPNKGDVVIWGSGAGAGYGHVAVFIEGDANKFTSFDENWPTLNVCTKTSHDYRNVLGWFQPISKVDPLIELQKKYNELEKELSEMRDSRDKWKKEATDLAKKILELNTQIESMQKSNSELTAQLTLSNTTSKEMIKSLNERIDTLTSSEKSLREDCSSLQTQLDLALSSQQEMRVKIDKLTEKLNLGLDGYSRLELFKKLVFGR